jgi:hypothetical protein
VATKRDPRPDVRAADLQEKPTKRVKNKAGSPETIVSSDPTKTAATQRTSQRAERAIKHSERSERSNTASEAIK